VNRQEWRRSGGKRERRRLATETIREVCDLYVSGFSIPTIAKKTVLPEKVVGDILLSVDRHLEEANREGSVVKGGGSASVRSS
jgi:hypothetical protein